MSGTTTLHKFELSFRDTETDFDEMMAQSVRFLNEHGLPIYLLDNGSGSWLTLTEDGRGHVKNKRGEFVVSVCVAIPSPLPGGRDGGRG